MSKVEEYFRMKNNKPKIQVPKVKKVDPNKVKLKQEKEMIKDLWADCKLNVFGVLPSAVPIEKSMISAPEVPKNIASLSREEKSQYQLSITSFEMLKPTPTFVEVDKTKVLLS